MGQTLTHGVYLPDEGERNCYSGLAANWQLLDNSVGTIAEHTTALAGKAPFVHTHKKSDVTDLLNSNFVPSSNGSYNLGSLTNRWRTVYGIESNVKSENIDFTDTTTTGTKAHWHLSSTEKNGSTFFQIGSQRNHSAGLNEEHFRIKNVNDKWADLYIQLDDSNQFSIGTTTHSDVTNNGFKGKFTPFDSFIPYTNNSYDLGSSDKQWNNLYAKNYYYNGTAWGLDQNNIWTGANSFYKSIQIRGGRNAYIMPEFAASYSGLTFGTVEFKQPFKFGDWVDNNSTIGLNTSNAYVEIYAGLDSSDNVNKARISPSPNATTAELGTATAKWKTLNGINPGALSLPVTALNNTYDISGNITDLTGGNNSITAARTGWIFVKSDNATGISIENTTTGMGASDHSASAATLMVSVPVTSGESVNIIANCTSIDKAYLLPCQGNV